MISNKRGAEESGGAIVIFVLVLIVAAVIAYATYAFFFKINTTIDAQAIETTNMVLSCQKDLKLASTDEGKLAAYCGNFRYPLIVGGKKSYVNCAFLKQNNLVSFTTEEVPQKVVASCNSTVSSQMAYNKCYEFNRTNAGDSTSWLEYINGMKCDKSLNATKFGLDVAPTVEQGNIYSLDLKA